MPSRLQAAGSATKRAASLCPLRPRRARPTRPLRLSGSFGGGDDIWQGLRSTGLRLLGELIGAALGLSSLALARPALVDLPLSQQSQPRIVQRLYRLLAQHQLC